MYRMKISTYESEIQCYQLLEKYKANNQITILKIKCIFCTYILSTAFALSSQKLLLNVRKISDLHCNRERIGNMTFKSCSIYIKLICNHLSCGNNSSTDEKLHLPCISCIVFNDRSWIDGCCTRLEVVMKKKCNPWNNYKITVCLTQVMLHYFS